MSILEWKTLELEENIHPDDIRVIIFSGDLKTSCCINFEYLRLQGIIHLSSKLYSVQFLKSILNILTQNILIIHDGEVNFQPKKKIQLISCCKQNLCCILNEYFKKQEINLL